MQLILKASGMILVIICTTSVGIAMAATLKKRVGMLEASLAALGALEGELSYGMAAPDEAIYHLETYESLADLPFLAACAAHCRNGLPFPTAWKQALHKAHGELTAEDTVVLSGLADTIGQRDLDSQLMSIRQTKDLLEVQLSQARSRYASHGKIYHTMGVLAGIFIVIVCI